MDYEKLEKGLNASLEAVGELCDTELDLKTTLQVMQIKVLARISQSLEKIAEKEEQRFVPRDSVGRISDQNTQGMVNPS